MLLSVSAAPSARTAFVRKSQAKRAIPTTALGAPSQRHPCSHITLPSAA